MAATANAHATVPCPICDAYMDVPIVFGLDPAAGPGSVVIVSTTPDTTAALAHLGTHMPDTT